MEPEGWDEGPYKGRKSPEYARDYAARSCWSADPGAGPLQEHACWSRILRLPAPKTVRDKCLLVKPPSLQYFCYSASVIH